MLPVPFIYLFARKFLIWGYHKPVIGPVQVLHHQGGKGRPQTGGKKAGKSDRCPAALCGDPAAGTGAWTGTLAASIGRQEFKDVLIACMGGVLLAGIIMGLASAGLLGAVSGLFAAG